MASATQAAYRGFPNSAGLSPVPLPGSKVEHHYRPFTGATREDRIASVFGLSSGRTLPSVHPKSLSAYYEYLRVRLSIPFQAEYCALDDRTVRKVAVVGLFSPMRPGIDLGRGLVCLARTSGSVLTLPLVDLEVPDDDPNFQLLEDYWYWAWNWGPARAGHAAAR